MTSDNDAAATLTASPLHATATIGVASIATLALSVITAKAVALFGGPEGVGVLALLQSVLNLGVVLGSFGLATSAIQTVTKWEARQGLGAVRTAVRAALIVGLIGGAIGAVAIVLLRGPLAENVLGSEARSSDLLLIAPALTISIVASVCLAALSGLHRIRWVAAINIGTGVVATASVTTSLITAGIDGLAAALLLTAVAQLGFSLILLSRALGGSRPVGSLLQAARELFHVGGGVAISQAITSGVQLLLPVLVLQAFSTPGVGIYRAAATVSIGYLTVFLASLMQDFLPRLARADNDEFVQLLERRMRLVAGLGVPFILGMLATAPWLLAFLYSDEFSAATGVLQWHLVGDLLRLPALVMLLPLLARRRMRMYVSAEIVLGVVVLAGTASGLLFFGLIGSGVGYAAAQVVYYVCLLAFTRAALGAWPGRLQGLLATTAVASMGLLLAPLDTSLRSAVFALLAGGAAFVIWPRLWAMHRAEEL
ncbi:MAG: oligosaccharide flippase family protein [Chloroflexota bacterium]|nr:oligosaccharide flippase family protein [Chloroflexota bacterium]